MTTTMDETETDTESVEIDFGDGKNDWFHQVEEEQIQLEELVPMEIEDPSQLKDLTITPMELIEDPIQLDELDITSTDIKIDLTQLEDLATNLIKIKEEQIQLEEIAINPIKIEPIEKFATNAIEVKEEPVPRDLNPIIYTTRLDDMFIFKQDLRNVPVQKVTNSIILESKPTLPKHPQNSYHIPYVKKIEDIEQKLHDIYHNRKDTKLCKNDSSNVNILLKLCRPISVVLKDISLTDKFKTVEKPRMKQKSSKMSKDVRQAKKPVQCFVFCDTYSGITDLYLIDSSGRLTDYYKFNKGIFRSYEDFDFLPGNETKKFINCCWYKREMCIQKLAPEIIPKITAKFMRVPHNCQECICCCSEMNSKNKKIHGSSSNEIVNDLVVFKEINEMEELDREISQALFKLKEKKCDSRISEEAKTQETRPITLIDKALEYKRKQKSVSSEDTTTYANDKGLKSVTIKYTKENETEFYEISNDGNVVTFIKSNSAIRMKTNAFVCCWAAREQEIKKFCLSPSSHRFLRTTHLCPIQNCVCCCKRRQENTNKPVLLSVTLPDYANHSPNFNPMDLFSNKLKKDIATPASDINNITTIAPSLANSSRKQQQKKAINDKNKLKFTNIRPKQTYSAAKTNSLQGIGSESVKGRNPSISTKGLAKVLPTTNNAEVKKSFTTDYSHSLNDDCGNKNNYVPVHNVFHNTPVVNVDKLNKVEVRTDANTTQTLDVDLLIATILDRFKDVRLTINEDGKVAAAINTPMHTLSTAELKVLANILAHAQEQVKALNLAPGANLNKHIEMLSKSSSKITNAEKVHVAQDGTDTFIQPDTITLSGCLDVTKLNLNIDSRTCLNSIQEINKIITTSSVGNQTAFTTISDNVSKAKLKHNAPNILSKCKISTEASILRRSLLNHSKVKNTSEMLKKLKINTVQYSDKVQNIYQHFCSFNLLKKQSSRNSFQSLYNVLTNNKQNNCQSIRTDNNRGIMNVDEQNESSLTSTPRIENVFSLRTTNISSENNGNQFGNKHNAEVKRKSAGKDCPVQSKIRVLTPSMVSAKHPQSDVENNMQKGSFSLDKDNKSQEINCVDENEIPKFVLVKPNDSKHIVKINESDSPYFIKILPRTETKSPEIQISPQTTDIQMSQQSNTFINKTVQKPQFQLENGIISLAEQDVQPNYNMQVVQSKNQSTLIPHVEESHIGTVNSLSGMSVPPGTVVINPGQSIPQTNQMYVGNIQFLPNTNLFPNPIICNVQSGEDINMAQSISSVVNKESAQSDCLSVSTAVPPIISAPFFIIDPRMGSVAFDQVNPELRGSDVMETIGASLGPFVIQSDNDNAIPDDVVVDGNGIINNDNVDNVSEHDKEIVKFEIDEDEGEDCILGM